MSTEGEICSQKQKVAFAANERFAAEKNLNFPHRHQNLLTPAERQAPLSLSLSLSLFLTPWTLALAA